MARVVFTPEFIAYIKKCERWSSGPYLCPAGYPTIGWGHLLQSLEHPPITKAQGEELLLADLRTAAAAAFRLSPVLLSASTGRTEAIVDFVFNLGAGRYRGSRLRRRVNARDWPGAEKEIRRWVYGAGKKLPGLVARRTIDARWLEAA